MLKTRDTHEINHVTAPKRISENNLATANERAPKTKREFATKRLPKASSTLGVPISKVVEHMTTTRRKPAAKLATKRIPVSAIVWSELSDLKSAGITYDTLLEGMIEREKKQRLVNDLKRIEARGKFVEMKW